MRSPNRFFGISPDKMPQHRVRITEPFYFGKYEVTQEQWEVVMGNNPSHFQGPKNPVEQVSWEDCQKFLKRLEEKLGGEKFRLPTEAEWKYACKAGRPNYFVDDESEPGERAWYDSNSGRRTHPVGEKNANANSLYDMHGNVWEWCADWYRWDNYGKWPRDNPTGPPSGSGRVRRGGSWDSGAGGCRKAGRSHFEPGNRTYDLGFRVSREPAE
jgi:formylglycine-generating enzyme required for sulfatase activity